MKFLAVIGALSYVFVSSYTAMLILGISHSFDGRVPAFGYWTVFFLSATIRLAVNKRGDIND